MDVEEFKRVYTKTEMCLHAILLKNVFDIMSNNFAKICQTVSNF